MDQAPDMAIRPGTDPRVRPKHERQAGAAAPRVMGTRFRPADPDAVRQRFATIRARAFERGAEEERLC